MITIPTEYFANDTVHRTINSDNINGVLSCGFLTDKNSSEENVLFDYYGALLVLNGEGSHIDKDGKERKLFPGCFVQRIPHKLHSSYISDKSAKWLEFFICFGKSTFDTLSNLNILNQNEDVLYPGMTSNLFWEFVEFKKRLKIAVDDELPVLLLEAQRIILNIYEMHRNGIQSYESKEVIKSACKLFSENQVRDEDLPNFCKGLGIGYETFRKSFKKHLGISPQKYIIQSRIDKAKSLLLDKYNSIGEISSLLGYSDSFSFSKQFHKYVGKSPSDYRKSFFI